MTQKETTIEFNKFQSFFYLDWCVISDLAPLIKNINDKKYKSKNIICDLLSNLLFNENYCFPYSTGHIQDISRGNGEKHKKHEINATALLHNFFRGWRISEHSINKEMVRVDKCFDLYEEVEKAKKTKSFVQETQDFCWSLIKPTLNTIINTQNSINPKNILPNDFVNSWDDFIHFSFNSIINNPLEKKRELTEKILFMNKIDMIQFINNKLEKSNYTFKSIEGYDKFHTDKFDKNISKFSSNINKIVNLSDIIGLTHEKNNQKTFPQNLLTDTTTHLNLGLRADAFFTKDTQLVYKAILCKKLLDLPVIIYHVKDDKCYLYK